MRREAKHPLLVGTVILVFLSIFTKSQASSPFESMNSVHLSMCQKDVRPSVKKWWRTMAFSSVSTGDSVIPSSCEMKYEPAFKPLQGNPAFIGSDPSSQHRLVCPAPMPLCPFNMQGPCTASLGSRLNSASYYEVCSLHEIPHSSRAELTSGVIQIIQTICLPVTSLMMVNSLRVENERLHFFFQTSSFSFCTGA